MPRVKAGELKLDEIRNLVRQHNKVSVIKGVDTKSRAGLIKEIEDMGYRVDHAGKKIVRGKMEISVSGGGERKPQKRTKRKALLAGGASPVLVSDEDKDKALIARRKAKQAKEKARKALKSGAPPIPPNVKGKAVRGADGKYKKK